MKTTIPKVHRIAWKKISVARKTDDITRWRESGWNRWKRHVYICALRKIQKGGGEEGGGGARKIKVCQYATTDRFTE